MSNNPSKIQECLRNLENNSDEDILSLVKVAMAGKFDVSDNDKDVQYCNLLGFLICEGVYQHVLVEEAICNNDRDNRCFLVNMIYRTGCGASLIDIYENITDEEVRNICLDRFVKIHIGRYEYLKENVLDLSQYVEPQLLSQ